MKTFPSHLLRKNPFYGYDELLVEEWLRTIYPRENRFINEGEITGIRKSLIIKYGNDKECFLNISVDRIQISDLFLYQPYVGIHGPKHSNINDPVYVIKVDNRYILYNGYHRFISYTLNEKNSICAHILEI